VLFLAIAAAAVVFLGSLWKLHTAAPKAYVTTAADRGPVTPTVIASGTVNPVNTIQVGSYVSGVIQTLSCDFNTRVRAGQLCAKLNPRPYQSVVDQETANLATANAQLQKDLANLAFAKIIHDRTEATLEQARAAVRVARGSRLPQISIGANATRAAPGAGADSGAANSASVGRALAFDADVAGAGARRVEQALALEQAQQAQWRASRLTLIGNIVSQSIALASAVEQASAAQDILAADQRSLELVRVSVAAGKNAGLDVLTTESVLASDRALVPPLQQQASAAGHALAILAGQNPSGARASEVHFDFTTLALPREIPLTLPSELVRRRPDIALSEAQLHATSAAIGIAAAQLYPAVTLSATWTRAAVGNSLFAQPATAWRIAADAVAPLFNGGTLRAQRDAAVHAYAAQLGAYRQTVLQAFAQVADALQALVNDAALLDAQRKALAAAQATLDLTLQSYQAGQASFPQVIEAQRLFQLVRLGHVRANAQRYNDTLQLFVSLGEAEP
jgi:NodT family efflux transporter outer membrane factor (OMF) lipoprotein